MNRLDQFEALAEDASPAPWKAMQNFKGDDWLIGFGQGHDGNEWVVCTDRIHCSDMLSGGAGEDAKLIAAARDLAPALLHLARTAQDCVEKLGYLEPANLTDTERHVMRQLRGALAPLLEEVPDANR